MLGEASPQRTGHWMTINAGAGGRVPSRTAHSPAPACRPRGSTAIPRASLRPTLAGAARGAGPSVDSVDDTPHRTLGNVWPWRIAANLGCSVRVVGLTHFSPIAG